MLPLQSNLDVIEKWSRDNQLSLNVKCRHMTFTPKCVPVATFYSINGQILQRIDTVKYLGVTFDVRLFFHILKTFAWLSPER